MNTFNIEKIDHNDMELIYEFLNNKSGHSFSTIGSLKQRIETRLNCEIAHAITTAACFVMNHPMECWDTQVTIERKLYRRFDKTLSKQILNHFLDNLRRGKADFYTLEFILFVMFYAIDKNRKF